MAKKSSKPKKEVPLEQTLWKSCDKLRGAVEPAEYKHVMLSLIFLKYANDKFDEQREKMIANGQEQFLEMLPFYERDNIFFIPECARWEFLKREAKQDDIAITLDTALHEIELKNPTLAGALPDNYYSRLQLDDGVLASLIDKLDGVNLKKEPDKDVFGRIYEYFLSHFAIKEGKGKGEYFTPKSVVSLLCELIEPYSGIVYDGACGSGGMFVQSMKFVEEHQGSKKDITVYGQEYTPTTMKLAKMNLAIRGISANLGDKATSTFAKDHFPDLKADYALMNPPFNQKDWREENELEKDPRWKGYPTPYTGNANYAWILNMISKLSTNGTGCLLLANGAMSSSDGTDYEIRKQLIENDIIEAIIVLPNRLFYSTDISVTIWIFNRNKHAKTVVKGTKTIQFRERENEVLFIDLRQAGHPYEKKYVEFTVEDREYITNTFHNWQTVEGIKDYKDIKQYCASVQKEKIVKNDYSLVLSKYVEFDRKEEEVDYKARMEELSSDLGELLIKEEANKKELLAVLRELGYEIEL